MLLIYESRFQPMEKEVSIMEDMNELYVVYRQTVFGYLLRISRNADLAEELTQETFYQASRRIDQFRGDSSLSTWLCGIARNLFHTELRKRKTPPPADLPTEPPPDPLDLLVRSDRAMEGQRALHQLSEPYREVFTLRTFCDLSHAQIGSLFGKSEAWARVTYYRARQRLAEALKEEKQ